MSHVVTLDLEIRNLEAVKQTCKKLGWIFKENQKTYQWWGHWVDDSPVPRQLFSTQAEYEEMIKLSPQERRQKMNTLLGHCDHAIAIPGQQFEIGLIKRGQEYVMIWDWASNLRQILGDPAHPEINPFPAAYLTEEIRMEAEAQGFFVQETRQGKNIILEAVKY